MPDEIGRVTILAVGVWQYQHMRRLTGPERDLQNLRDVLINDPELAIFERRQYRELQNPTSADLRQAINQYVVDRGADNDVLLFYFSGHGAPIGGSDFAFCTIDTNRLVEERSILPMTAVSFTEILRTLWIKKVIPVFIIDACFSGMAGGALLTTISQVVDELKGEVQRRYASSYALFCSAPSDEEVLDNPNGDGGLFSTSLIELARNGLNSRDRRSQTISLAKLYPYLRERAERNAVGPTPILLIGPTLPDFSIFKNVYYRPLGYRLQPHLVAVLRAFWNNGEPRQMRPSDINRITREGSYGNNKKLVRQPWALVEILPNSQQRRLSERGLAFMRGEIRIPRDVISIDQENYQASPNTELVGIDDFPEE